MFSIHISIILWKNYLMRTMMNLLKALHDNLSVMYYFILVQSELKSDRKMGICYG